MYLISLNLIAEVKFLEIEGIKKVLPRDNYKPSLEKR